MTSSCFARAWLAGILIAASPSALPAQGVPVSGEVRWIDPGGTAHPVRGADVEVVDADRSTPVGTTRTDRNGSYTLSVDAPALRNLYVQVLSRSAAAGVVEPGTQRPHRLRSRTYPLPANGLPLRVDTLAVGADGTGSAADSIANEAFSVLDALEHGAEHLARRGEAALGPIEVRFPVEPGDGNTSSFYGKHIEILRAHRWDWDVVLHEFGHYVAKSLGLAVGGGGPHYLEQPVGGEKKDAARVAWSEGFASYFSIVSQREPGLSGLGLPWVGDTRYTDAGAGQPPGVDLNTPDDPTWSFGERSEVTVMRTLYNLDDAETDPANPDRDRLALGPDTIWSMLRSGNPTTLDEAWRLIAARLDPAEREQAAAILSDHGVAPLLLKPADGAAIPKAQARFSWSKPADYGRFTLEIVTDTGETLHRADAAGGTYTIKSAEWQLLVAKTKGGSISWRVHGESRIPPATGPYGSPFHRLVPAKGANK